jgi:AraC-like DNA-binding protein
MPDGCIDAVWERGVGVKIAGPDTAPKLIDRSAGDLMIGIRFRPGAGGPVLGVPIATLRDLHVDAGDVNPALELDGELAPEEVLRRFAQLAAEARSDPLIAEAVRRVDHEDVRSISRALWVSERQLRRRFHAAVGYGPRTLARVLRFRRFLDALDRGRSDLAALAFEVGYADQAHLTREVKLLSGLTPAALARGSTPR